MAEEEKKMRRVPKEQKERAPVTRVKSSGRVNRKLQMLAELYKRNNPGRDVRMVYDPKHKPDLSNILSRQVDGYSLVLVKDLGEDAALPGLKPDEPVRVGDTVMMSIAAEERAELQALNDKRAADELLRVEQEYNAAIEGLEVKKGGKTYKPSPMGRSIIEPREGEVAGPESHSEASET